MQKNLDAKHAQCQEDLNRLSSSKKSYIDQRINKSFLLQEAMLQYPILHTAPVVPAAAPHQRQSPLRSFEGKNVEHQSCIAPIPEATYRLNYAQQKILENGDQSIDHSTHFKKSDAERDLAAALELQLGSYISKLNQVGPLKLILNCCCQGYSKRNLSYQKVVINNSRSRYKE